MIAVDLWAPAPNARLETYKDWDHEERYMQLKAVSEKWFPGRVDIRRMDTVEAAKTVQDESLDFVFIDADHSYEGCLADIQAWTPKVRRGGMIAGHDFNAQWPGVIRAVSETGEFMVTGKDSVWFRIKK